MHVIRVVRVVRLQVGIERAPGALLLVRQPGLARAVPLEGSSAAVGGKSIEVAEVVLTDDNFSSCVTGIKWGRNIRDAACKFIQFQICITAVFVMFLIVQARARNVGRSSD